MHVQNGEVSAVLLTAEQVAQLLNLSERSVWRHLSAGRMLEPVRIGGCVRWHRDKIMQWIADGCTPPKVS